MARSWVLASIVACGSPSGMPTGTISIAGHELSVEVAANEYQPVACPACGRLHLINRKTGKLLGEK